MRPVLLVTNHVPPDRVGAFAALHARVPLELALFGGRSIHATAGVEDPGVPFRHVGQRDVHRLAASGDYRAVVAGTVGRVALPAAFTGARRAGVPFVLWSALWAHPRSAAHLAGSALLHVIYREAGAVAAYGEHVAAFAAARGARRIVVAPQAVDNVFWENANSGNAPSCFQACFVGRDVWEKGRGVLVEAWRASRLGTTAPAALVLVGARSAPIPTGAGGAVLRSYGPLPPAELRDIYARSSVLVMPSLPSRTFREPWGLVANEAMNQSVPVIASDAVGAAAGGLVRDGRNGLVVPAGDVPALTAALERLHDDPALRERLGANAKRDVATFTFDAWADGMETALRLASTGRRSN